MSIGRDQYPFSGARQLSRATSESIEPWKNQRIWARARKVDGMRERKERRFSGAEEKARQDFSTASVSPQQGILEP